MVVWKIPPPDQRTPPGSAALARFNREAEEVKSRPGEWALIAQNVCAGRGVPWKKRGFEVKYRTANPGKRGIEPERFDVYVRWNPDHVA
jgi:hypothetical protein